MPRFIDKILIDLTELYLSHFVVALPLPVFGMSYFIALFLILVQVILTEIG